MGNLNQISFAGMVTIFVVHLHVTWKQTIREV